MARQKAEEEGSPGDGNRGVVGQIIIGRLAEADADINITPRIIYIQTSDAILI